MDTPHLLIMIVPWQTLTARREAVRLLAASADHAIRLGPAVYLLSTCELIPAWQERFLRLGLSPAPLLFCVDRQAQCGGGSGQELPDDVRALFMGR